MKFRRRPTSLLAIWVTLSLSSSQLYALDPQKRLTQYSHTAWTQADGLPQDSIGAIAQTKDGFLWLGTEDGLTRFDGYEFKTFTKDSGLPSNSIKTLAAGRDGSLWMGTPNGLVRYKDRIFTAFTTKDGLPDNLVSSIFEDHAGVLWVTAGIYLSRFEGGKFHTYPSEALLPVRAVRVAYEDSHNTLWVAGVGGLVKLNKNGQFQAGAEPGELGDDLAMVIITVIVEDASHRLWMGSNKGLLLQTSEGKLRKFDERHGLPDTLIRVLWADRNGNLWVGTNTSLSRFVNEQFVVSALGPDLNRDWVRSLFEDREGDLWVGMTNGLNRYRDDRFTIYGRSEGLPSDEPVVVHQDRKGQVWVGYHGDGLVALENGKARVYSTRDGLVSNEIFAIRESRAGDLLISTREGLSWLRDGHFSNYVLPDALSRSYVFDTLEDRHGQIWVATSGGVYRHAQGTFRQVVPGGSFFNGAPVVLAEGKDGSIWAGTYAEGLWRIAGETTRRFTTADGPGSDSIRSLYQDPEGTLWIGTFYGGLNAYRDGRFTKFTEKDGLLSDNISHVDDDGHGYLWLSTTRGISRISKQQLYDFAEGSIKTLRPVNFGLVDGLRSAQCAPGFPVGGGGTRTSDGRLWFPTSRGVAVINPTESAKELGSPTPILHILDASANGRDLDLDRSLQLSPGQYHVQFRYVGIHLSAAERLNYEYKLEGLDRDWIAAGTRRVASYSSLDHGQYRFLVRASAPGRSSGEAVASLELEILPHFYQRQSFLWLCAISLVAAIYGLYQLRLKQIHSRFSVVLDERARMAREIHDTLAQGLVGISSQLDAVEMTMHDPRGSARQHLGLAQKMTRYSLTEAKRSVMDLRASALDQGNLSSALLKSARSWAAGTPIQIDVDVPEEHRALAEDLEQNILRIAQEAVTNTVKHAAAKNVRITLRVEERQLTLTVRDDGRGFDLSNAFSTAGGHFGLLGMRERAERLGGELTLSSQLGSGTELGVIVPLPPDKLEMGGWQTLMTLGRTWRSAMWR